MTLDQAKRFIRKCAEQMHAAYGKVVFDEWVVVSLGDKKGQVLAYIGPRVEEFGSNFTTDAAALRAGLLDPSHQPGTYEFHRQGVGTSFESFLVLGKGLYLICNNTVQHMDAITKDPRWIAAQVPFVDLSERFRQDPLVLAE